MGLLDFFKKGQEKPIERKPEPGARPASTPGSSTNPGQVKREYVIKSGDSLSKIAKEYYGNAGDWQKIYQANKGTIKDPNMIYPGQKIIIP
jgi:nucleoid-associated protein YgaU